MTKYKVIVWEESVVTYQVEANDEDQARDMINKNILRFEHKIIDEEVKDWDIEDVEEVEE
jgi:hypothetical protein